MNIFEAGLLNYFTQKQLSIIQSYKIGIAGCGGLGSNIANVMVRSGFKNLIIADYDVVEASNLNRQNYFLDEIGLPKVELTSNHLKKINPDTEVVIYNTKITEQNINVFFNSCDIIFEAFDNAASKVMIFKYSSTNNKVLIMGNGMAGLKNTAIKIRKIKDNIYIVGDGVTCVGKQNPPYAPRVITCAAMMCSVALNLILK